MGQVRRPFADWVENRLVPVLKKHPWVAPLAVLLLLEVYFAWITGRWDRLEDLALLAVLGAAACALWQWGRWRAGRWERLRARVRRRWEFPVCRHCGYDLRESLWRCPECGLKLSRRHRIRLQRRRGSVCRR